MVLMTLPEEILHEDLRVVSTFKLSPGGRQSAETSCKLVSPALPWGGDLHQPATARKEKGLKQKSVRAQAGLVPGARVGMGDGGIGCFHTSTGVTDGLSTHSLHIHVNPDSWQL